jgi:predicted acylesterase/phospholipase RssA
MLALTAVVNGCGSIPRPTPPSEGAQIAEPWGSVPVHTLNDAIIKNSKNSFILSLQAKRDEQRQTGESGKIPYRALTISGGGSRGAYGAGVLCGWTARGDRPQFDVVTGISTGALMATHVFLGSEFDNDLTIFKRISNRDVYRELSLLTKLRGASLLDTTPLRKTLMSVITEETLDLVAAEYRKGRRLFIGTTNLDANLFVIWDMGLIAESERPDRLKRYIDVVMASAAFPVAFPPVYLEVEGKDGNYTAS